MMLKILLVIGVIALIYFLFIKKKPLPNKTNRDDATPTNEMVACATCGTYTELGEAIISQNKYYCSNECVGKA